MKNYIIAAAVYPHPPIIIEEIGGSQSKLAAKTIEGVEALSDALATLDFDTIVLVSPHGFLLRDAFNINADPAPEGNFGAFRHPQLHYRFENDLEFGTRLHQNAAREGVDTILMTPERAKQYRIDTQLDHGVLVPLHFLSKVKPDFRLVSVTYALLPEDRMAAFGRCIRDTAQQLGRKTLLLASGDLSHRLSAVGPYGYKREGELFDEAIVKLIEAADFKGILHFDQELSEEAGECGLRSFQVLSGALEEEHVVSKLFSYEHPFGVGYATALLRIEEPPQQDSCIHLAKDSLQYFLAHGRAMSLPDDLPEELAQRESACFVSIHKNGELRGCIGTIHPTCRSLAQEIIQNAISAGTRDPRFPPVSLKEWDQLDFAVDILYEPEPIASIDELDVTRYGVIMTSGYRRGLLLPNLEGIDTAAQQVDIALQKAGIAPDEPFQMERFEVVRHKEE